MDWELNTNPVDVVDVGNLVPSEVLYEFDGPRIFSAQSPLGDLLCFLADDDGAVLRFIAAPTNPDILAKLKDGIRSVRDAIDQPWVWFVDLGYDGQPRAAWRGTLSDVPADALPEKGVMLWPHLEPFFALRAIGDGLSEGQVPMSVVRQVIEGATTALKKVANAVFDDAKLSGRKAKTIRQFYDLPTLGFAYNSFEAAFRLPEGQQAPLTGMVDETATALGEIAQKLEQALNWAIEISPDEMVDALPIELLEALEKLVPPKSGLVKCIEVRGRMFPNAGVPYRLTRDASTRVRQALREVRASQETITTVSGLVREFDKDNFSFTLRETDDGKDHLCRFPSEFYDELYEAFDRDERVTVGGREALKTGEIDVSLASRK
ncbi:hypothetical protein CCR95_19355 [Thiocystis minor]|uniref:hypothetical protein n=1 Tax=Thiocystis minor TaxID=61597 RepID=UPI001913B04F|nr:hypothetical protein [Thiocystis minor]MBK5966179.1 hypothetical protein [Thiocystis minor]